MPTLADVVAAIVEHESLEKTSATLGLTREQVVTILSEVAPPFTPPAKVRQRIAAQPSLALEPRPSTSTLRATLYSDGASRGNPGPSGAGAVLILGDGKTVRLGRFLGTQTNNVAEYQGVILGLEKALELGVKALDVRADSMLAMMQLKGEWKLKHPGLKPLFEKARLLAAQFESITYRHIPREQNGAADEMSNRAIDEKM